MHNTDTSAAPEFIGLAEAASLLGAAGRGGRPVHPATLSRWITYGVAALTGRVYLRAVRVGGKWATTADWVNEFTSATTAGHTRAATPAGRSPAERERAVISAVLELEAAGA